ncbi:MAG TPA: hypothetical protein VIS96_03485 [Terrimicrobiaceae bacterium]
MQKRSFLRQLGLRPTSGNGLFPPSIVEDFFAAGYDQEQFNAIDDWLSEEAMDLMFCSERTARYFLSSNFDRIVHSMQEITAAVPADATTVVEMGGGAGILSMWSALQRHNVMHHVLDRSANALAIGERWAKAQAITNIAFHKCSYGDVAAGLLHFTTADFVFADRAFRLDRQLRRFNLDFPLHGETLNAMYDDDAGVATKEFVEAGRTLTKPDGEFYVAYGMPTFESLYMVARAARECDLSIDWHRTDNSDGLQLSLRHTKGGTVFETPEEEARALCTARLETVECDRELSESLKCLFDRGRPKVILRAEYADPNGNGYLELLVSDGFALLFEGYEHVGGRAVFASASTLPDLAKRAAKWLTEGREMVSGSFVVAPRREVLQLAPKLETVFG